MAKSKEELKKMLDRLVATGREYGMEINAEETKATSDIKTRRTAEDFS